MTVIPRHECPDCGQPELQHEADHEWCNQCGYTKTSIQCPVCGEKYTYTNATNKIKAEVDAGLHWIENHDGPIPESAPFGRYQCPRCLDLHGMNGTVSCSECGHIPVEVRL